MLRTSINHKTGHSRSSRKSLFQTHPFRFHINVPINAAFSLNGRSYRSAENFLDATISLANALQIKDFVHIVNAFSSKSSTPHEPRTNILFCTENEEEYWKLRALIQGDTPHSYTKKIQSTDALISECIERHFRAAICGQSAKSGITRTKPDTFIVSIHGLFAAASIYIPYSRGDFNRPPEEKNDKEKTPALLQPPHTKQCTALTLYSPSPNNSSH